MKLLNIFKKEKKSTAKTSVQTLDKNQLEKVIGGGGPTVVDPKLSTDAIRSFNKAY